MAIYGSPSEVVVLDSDGAVFRDGLVEVGGQQVSVWGVVREVAIGYNTQLGVGSLFNVGTGILSVFNATLLHDGDR
jgi:hypothetical protein